MVQQSGTHIMRKTFTYRLEKIQRKAARFIKNDYKSTTPGSVTNMLIDLDLQTLQDRRKDKRLCFLAKICYLSSMPPVVMIGETNH